MATPPPHNRCNPRRQQQAVQMLNWDEIIDASKKADIKANTDVKPPL